MREGIGDFLFLFFRWGGTGKNAERGMKAARRRGRMGAHHRPGRGTGGPTGQRIGCRAVLVPYGSRIRVDRSDLVRRPVAGVRGPTLTRRTGVFILVFFCYFCELVFVRFKSEIVLKMRN
jgi:hypothetical protein